MVDLVLGFLAAFLLVVFGTNVGAKMALRSFFGDAFVDAETGEFILPEPDVAERPDEDERGVPQAPARAE